MKQTLLVVAMLVASFVAGCEDATNIVNAPTVGQGSQTKLQKPGPRTVSFSASLIEPGTRNAFTRVNGTVSYMMTLLTRDPVPPLPQAVAVIDLNVSATLTDLWNGASVGNVSGSTHTEVAIRDEEADTAERETFFERKYQVRGREDGYVLVVKFSVTRNEIKVSNVHLSLEPISSD
jgi:hypothetical protein